MSEGRSEPESVLPVVEGVSGGGEEAVIGGYGTGGNESSVFARARDLGSGLYG